MIWQHGLSLPFGVMMAPAFLPRAATVAAMQIVAWMCIVPWIPRPAAAVIILGSSAGNTSPPSGSLGVRWSQVGNFDMFLGTPIAPGFFLTAKHLGNLTGSAITFPDNTSYTTTAWFEDPASDLAIYQISGTFPEDKIVPLYSGTTFSANAPLTIFGRGVPRTDTAIMGDAFGGGSAAKGWSWGTGMGTRSWGTNTLSSLTAAGAAGMQLRYTFSPTGPADEGTLSFGDSGGPVFVEQAGEWRLAGINYAVDNPFNTSATGTGFDAAIYDTGGLYASLSGDIAGPWSYVSPTLFSQPASSFSTAVPASSDWIAGVIAVPEPEAAALVVAAVLTLAMLRPPAPRRGTADGGSAGSRVPFRPASQSRTRRGRHPG